MILPTETDIAIVGGGPIGLFLACALTKRGFSCLVLEKRESIATHSRAIGIHSPALEGLASVGVADPLVGEGIAVRRGWAYWCDRPLARLRFADALRCRYPFALALPQSRTEAVLEQRLQDLAPGSLVRGAEVCDLTQTDDGVRLTVAHGKSTQTIRAAFCIACDGKNSPIRERCGIGFRGRYFPDTYAMGDFADDTDFGPEAIIFLTPGGVVESFPLPGNLRRWVLYTGKASSASADNSPQTLTDEVYRRTRVQIDATSCTMSSTFGIQNLCADTLVSGRVILAGDAAHVCSPIGGQGMNCGLLNALTLAEVLPNAVTAPQTLSHYDRFSRQRARTVAQRATFNTLMGRGGPDAVLRAVGMTLLLKVPPAHDHFARRFTMQDLG